MKLSYRGQTYDRNPSVTTATDVTVEGKYRGANTKVHMFENLQVRRSNADLTYRGVKYHK